MKIAVLVRYEPVARRLLELRSSGAIVRISGREELLATLPDTNVLVVANGGLRFRYIDMDAARAAGVRVATVPAQNSASVAEPLDETTFHMFGSELFRAMKPGSSLINVSRAALVVRHVLRSALDAGSLSSYATDVWWDEPVDPTDPLLDRDNVLLSPHLGGATEEFLERTLAVIADNLSRFAAGISPLHLVV